MGFHEVRFPASLSFGSIGGPQRHTDVVTLANGFEERNTPWAHSRRRYDAGAAMRSVNDLEKLIAFFEARQGQLYGFRWKDWADYKSCPAQAEPSHLDQVIEAGDGIMTHCPMHKSYQSGGHSYQRLIAKPVKGSVLVGLDGVAQVEGVDYIVDHATGVINFSSPPAAGQEITCGYEFDVPVRFDTDRLSVNLSTFHAGDVPSVPVVEVRV